MFDRVSKDNLPLGPQKGLHDKKELGNESKGIQTIPNIFYGGSDPDIYRVQSPPKSNSGIVKPVQKKPLKKNVQGTKPVKVSKIKYFFIIFAIILFVSAIVFAVWYYFFSSGSRLSTESTPEPRRRPVIVVDEPEEKDEKVEEPVILEKNESISESASSQDKLVLPRLVTINQDDLDIDDLNDAEEEFFGTDVGLWDSDEDGYFDGQEVVNLYSPKDPSPARLIDSGVVREYVNPTWQYRVYYPSSWVSSAVDSQARQVLINAITGDYVNVSVFDKNSVESFSSWFGRVVDGQQFTDLQEKVNRFSQSYFVRRDGLVAYYNTDTQVYVLIYTPGSSNVPLYSHVMDMMVQSFRPRGVGTFLPEQPILPSENVVPVPPEVILPTSTINELSVDEVDDVSDSIDLDDLL